MHKVLSSKWSLFASVAVIGVGVFLMRDSLVVGAETPIDTIGEANATSTESISSSVQTMPGLPIRLTIQTVAVDAVFESVGLTAAGKVGVPKDPAHAAWFNLGPRPGEIGNSVIVGHSGWRADIPAVFDMLFKIQKGDGISVEDDLGNIRAFRVRELQVYKASTETIGDIFSLDDGKAHLILITCEGIWDATTKSYSGRLVVFADME